MEISKKSDYAIRAILELASTESPSLTTEQIATSQRIPLHFLENIVLDLRRADMIVTQRGAGGGCRLAQPPSDITLADVVRAVDGPLLRVQGARPEAVQFEGVASPLRDVWIAVRVSIRSVLEATTIANLIEGQLPPDVADLLRQPGAYGHQ
jgi:Rrf2 family protein